MLKRLIGVLLISAAISTTIMINIEPIVPIKARDTKGMKLNTYSRKENVDKVLEITETHRLERERIELEKLEIQRLEEIRIEEERIAQLKPNYNPNNLREPSNLTEEQIYLMLEGKPLQSLSRAYYYAEQEFGVNALFLIALNVEESGWGRSSLSISNNNLGGIKRKDGSFAYFEHWGESLNYIANLIDKNYLNENGLFYNGTSIWNVNVKYCEQKDWADKINKIAYQLLNKIY